MKKLWLCWWVIWMIILIVSNTILWLVMSPGFTPDPDDIDLRYAIIVLTLDAFLSIVYFIVYYKIEKKENHVKR